MTIFFILERLIATAVKAAMIRTVLAASLQVSASFSLVRWISGFFIDTAYHNFHPVSFIFLKTAILLSDFFPLS